jgi:hypothetical protein
MLFTGQARAPCCMYGHWLCILRFRYGSHWRRQHIVKKFYPVSSSCRPSGS